MRFIPLSLPLSRPHWSFSHPAHLSPVHSPVSRRPAPTATRSDRREFTALNSMTSGRRRLLTLSASSRAAHAPVPLPVEIRPSSAVSGLARRRSSRLTELANDNELSDADGARVATCVPRRLGRVQTAMCVCGQVNESWQKTDCTTPTAQPVVSCRPVIRHLLNSVTSDCGHEHCVRTVFFSELITM